MKTRLVRWLWRGVVGAAVTAGVAVIGVPSGDAADHRDAPGVTADPASDINDVYAWTTMDAGKLNLVMTVSPFADGMSAFSDAVQYVFHLNSSAAYGMPATEATIVCEFAANQAISCWAGSGDAAAYITGDASDVAGIADADGKIKVFAGLRNDPFFFNLNGFKHAVETVVSVAGGLTFDPNGCPAVDSGTSAVLVGMLQHDTDGMTAATDTFKGAETLAIVVQVDKALVTAGGPIVGVWASTHSKP